MFIFLFVKKNISTFVHETNIECKISRESKFLEP